MEVAVVAVEVTMSDRGSRVNRRDACGLAILGAKSAAGRGSCIAGMQDTLGNATTKFTGEA
jgi:hypothetical protein